MKLTAKNVEKLAKKLDPKGFSEWLEENEVKHRIHDANLRDHNDVNIVVVLSTAPTTTGATYFGNDGWYIVELEVEEGKFEVCYLYGEFEQADVKID